MPYSSFYRYEPFTVSIHLAFHPPQYGNSPIKIYVLIYLIFWFSVQYITIRIVNIYKIDSIVCRYTLSALKKKKKAVWIKSITLVHKYINNWEITISGTW